MSKQKPYLSLVTCSALAFVLAGAPGFAQSDKPVGVIKRFHRDADPKRITPDNQSHRLYRDYGFFVGDTLVMNKGACVPAVVGEDTQLTLGKESKLRIAAAETASGGKELAFELLEGGITVEVPAEHAGKLLVRTSNTELRLGQGTFAVALNDEGLTEVLAYDGPVKIASLGEPLGDYGAQGRFLHAIHRGRQIELLHFETEQPVAGPPKLQGLDCAGSPFGGPDRNGDPGGDGESNGNDSGHG